MADRGHAPAQILMGRMLCLAGSGSLAVYCWWDGVPSSQAEVAPVMFCSLLTGFGFTVSGPAMQSIIPKLMRPGELPTAIALNSLPMTTARIAGPALGAVVAAGFGAASAFALAALLHLPFLILLLIFRLPAGPLPRADVDYSVRGGFLHIWRDRPLLVMLLAVTGAAFGAEPAITLTPAIAQELRGGTSVVGLLAAAFGVGSGVGLAMIPALTRRAGSAIVACLGLGSMAVGLGLLALAPNVHMGVTGFGVCGVGFSSAMTSLSTLIQQRSPEELRGRVMAVWLVAFAGSRPFAAMLDGLLADLVSVTFALGFSAVVLGSVALMCRPRRLSRPLDANRTADTSLAANSIVN